MVNYRELLEKLESLPQGRPIGVIGDLMADRFIYGDAERLSPEAPVPVVRITSMATMPGGAANVARNILGLGGAMALFGVLGEDDAANEVEEKLRIHGADLNGVVRLMDRPTTLKTRIVARSQHMLRYDEEQDGEVSDATVDDIIRRLGKVIDTLSVLVFSDYSKGVLTSRLIGKVRSMCDDFGVKVIVDPKPVHVPEFRGVEVLKPNLGEAMRLIGREKRPGPDELEQFTREVHAVAEPKNLIITAGGDGMYVLAYGEFFHLPGFQREVYDVAGAGDTTLAAIALGLASGLDMLGSARLGNFAGAVAVGKLGTALVTMDELKNDLRAVVDGHH